MIEWFRLEDVNHSPAFFDVAKLTHMNGEYIRAMATDEFIDACRPWLTGDRAPWPRASFDEAVFAHVAPLVQERVSILSEVPAMVDFLFLDEPVRRRGRLGRRPSPAMTSAGTILSGAIEAYRALAAAGDWNRDAAPCRHPGGRRGGGPQVGEGPGADPGGHHRSAGGTPAVRGPRGPRARSDPAPPAGRPGPRRRPVRGSEPGPARSRGLEVH